MKFNQLLYKWIIVKFICVSKTLRDWGQEEKGRTEDEMAGWHHWLNGRESEWTLGVGDGQGGLACCDSWGRKESDTTEWLNWTELKTLLINTICWYKVNKVEQGRLFLLTWSYKIEMIHRHLYKMFSEVFWKWVSSILFPLLCKICKFYFS